jgi:drug efflux transport system ATP-binding protein
MVNAQEDHPIVRVTGFCKRYKKMEAVKGVDLDIQRGEIYGLIGPDAAGKSSLMKAIAGVLSYEKGHVEVFGTLVDSERAAERIKARIGFLPQGLGQNLYPDLSVEENVDFFARLRLVPEQELSLRKERLLKMTRLEPFRHRSMKHLSGGMKQKLGLICTLIHEPDLIILDEPTTGVDPVSRRDFWSILAELVQERGLTALVSTAYMDEAARFHRLSLMFQGQVLASGKPLDIQALTPGSVVTIEVQPQVNALAQLKGAFAQVEAMGPALRVFVDDQNQEAARKQVTDTLQGLRIDRVMVDSPNPEDAFVALLRQHQLVQSHAEATPIGPEDHSGNHDGLAIEARGLIREFGKFRAVDEVSFTVKEGEIFGLLGSNGAGKTTVIKMLTGILQPTGGEGSVAGIDMRRAKGRMKERIGYMSQAFSLYLDLTVVENIRLFAGVYGLANHEARARLDWIVTMADLKGFETMPAGQLPMGVRQRLALGCALVHKPRVLFLDEPTSGVDPIGRRHFWEILLHLARAEGVALLVTTHYMSEAEHCDHLALMYAGRVISEGAPSFMKAQVEKEAGVLLELITNQPALALSSLKKAGFPGAALFGTNVHLLSLNPEQDKARIHEVCELSGVVYTGISQRPLSLEDVFVYRIVEQEQRDTHLAATG